MTAWIDGPGSLLRRPDAISPDYLTSRTPGPEQVGDSSKGPSARAWQVDALTPGKVYLQRGEDTVWGEKKLLFEYTGERIVDVDVAFDQNSNVVVCMQRGDFVWLYFFDSLTGQFELERVCIGRTPRVVLDDPGRAITGESDVVLFYLSDEHGRLEYRQQRDRFGVVYPGPLSNIQHLYLEDVARTTDLRVRLLFSLHNPVNGTYELLEIDTLRFPYTLNEPWTMPHAELLGGKFQEIGPPECWTMSHAELTGGRLAALVLNYAGDPESWTMSHAQLLGGLLKTLVQSYTLPTPESWMMQHPTLRDGLLKQVVVSYTFPGSENWTMSHAQLLGGTLVNV